MKRVLKITATDGTTTARVRIEVECTKKAAVARGWTSRELAGVVVHSMASGVMEAIRDANCFEVPLSEQRVGR